MKSIYLFSLLIFTLLSCEEKKDTWIAFSDNDQSLIGFKDESGKVKISPKFMGFTAVKKFDAVVAVMEEKGEKWDSYYLLKNGKQFGRDSLYVNDATFDCESEGYIRFVTKDMVGMFNSKGKVAVPANYNTLTRFTNGIAFATKGAVKKVDEHPYEGSPGWYWAGGKGYIINTKNEILAENVTSDADLDSYSLEITNKPSEETYRTSFKALNGKYYSFINNKEHFRQFLKKEILSKLSESTLSKNAYSQLVYWNEDKGWLHQPSIDYIKEHKTAMLNALALAKPGNDYYILSDSFTPVPEDMEKEFSNRYDNCGNLNNGKYPIMSLIINRQLNGENIQDSFTFIKVDDSYKLLTVTLRSEQKR